MTPPKVSRKRDSGTRSSIELTERQIRRLAEDASIVAAAALIYAPPNQRGSKRIQRAGSRILRMLKIGHMVEAWR